MDCRLPLNTALPPSKDPDCLWIFVHAPFRLERRKDGFSLEPLMRKTVFAALTLTALSSAALVPSAFAQDAARNPAPLSQGDAPQTYRYDDVPADTLDSLAPPRTNAEREARREQRIDTAQAWQRRDLFCRRDAGARTGFTSPHEAARDEQARGAIGGTIGGAVLGAIIGGAAGDAGAGAAIGAGAGLLGGAAVGSSNGRRAAADVEAAYGDAYQACMDTAQDEDIRGFSQRDRLAYDDLPPPVYVRPYPGPYYAPYPYGPRAYGPSFGFSFGFGPSYRGFYGPPRGYRRGWR